MAFDVFISYSSQDKPTADAACATLEGAGIRCWIAPRDILPGTDYGESIVNALENAKVFVLIFSNSANASAQIKREVERAVSKGIPIIPVRIEDVVPSKTLEYFISTPHWLDAFPPPREKYFAKLIESVQGLLGGERGSAPTDAKAAKAPATFAKKPTGRRLFALAAVAAAFVLVVAGGYTLNRMQSQPLVRTLTGHGAEVDSVAFSPDGKLIAAGGGYDASIDIWTTADGQLQSPVISGFYGHTAPFSPDGKTIASGSDDNVRIWDAASGRVLHTYSGHTDKVLAVAFSHDGKLLASGGKDKMVFVWDLAGNAPVRQLAGHADQVYSVAFSTDGKWIASASFDQKVIVWDVASGQPVKTLTGSNKMIAAIFSSDDRWLATAGWDGNVTIWDIDSWQPVRVFPGDGQIVTSTAFSPDNKLIASGGYDHAVKLWDTATGALVRTFDGHSDIVWGVAFSPDGKTIASASGDRTVKIWKTP
ncbi:MAG: TIR domain-containing protein [Roseiarcus sp.]